VNFAPAFIGKNTNQHAYASPHASGASGRWFMFGETQPGMYSYHDPKFVNAEDSSVVWVM
jgi:hypothetical protein